MTLRPVEQALAQLAEIPDLVAEVVATAYAPNPAPTTGRGGGRVPDVPANLTVHDLLRGDKPEYRTPPSSDPAEAAKDDQLQDSDSHLLWRLHEAERVVAQEALEAGWELPAAPSPYWTQVCTWLAVTAEFWAGHRLTREWVTDNVADVHAALERAARVPREPVLRCNHTGTHGDQCGARLHEEAGGALMRCEAGHEISHWAAVRREIELQDLPLAEVLRTIERHWQARVPSYETAKKWAQSGVLVKTGKAANGRPLYNVAQVRRAAAERMLKRAQ